MKAQSGFDEKINQYSANKDNIFLFRSDYIVCKISRNEKKINYKRLSSITNDELLIFILNIPFGYLSIFEKDSLCFHGASFLHNNDAVILSGFSGSGKSTLLYEMLKNGLKMISEDVCKIYFHNKKYLVSTSFPVLKINKNCMNDEFIDYKIDHRIKDNRKRSFYKINELNNPKVNLNELSKIILLKEGNSFKVNNIKDSEKFIKLLPHIFKIPVSGNLVPVFKDDILMENIFNKLAELLNNVDIFEVEKNNIKQSDYNGKLILDFIK